MRPVLSRKVKVNSTRQETPSEFTVTLHNTVAAELISALALQIMQLCKETNETSKLKDTKRGGTHKNYAYHHFIIQQINIYSTGQA